jgi:hypothetical protein
MIRNECSLSFLLYGVKATDTSPAGASHPPSRRGHFLMTLTVNFGDEFC